MQDNLLAIHSLLGEIQNYWQPKIIKKGDFDFRLVKFSGEFDWHCHQFSDKVILVVAGEMGIRFSDGQNHVIIKEGEMYVIPKDVSHQPYATQECQIVLIEQANKGE